MNGGTCLDGVDNFTCSCPPSLTGKTCECLILESGLLNCSYILPITTEIPVSFTKITEVPSVYTTLEELEKETVSQDSTTTESTVISTVLYSKEMESNVSQVPFFTSSINYVDSSTPSSPRTTALSENITFATTPFYEQFSHSTSPFSEESQSTSSIPNEFSRMETSTPSYSTESMTSYSSATDLHETTQATVTNTVTDVILLTEESHTFFPSSGFQTTSIQMTAETHDLTTTPIITETSEFSKVPTDKTLTLFEVTTNVSYPVSSELSTYPGTFSVDTRTDTHISTGFPHSEDSVSWAYTTESSTMFPVTDLLNVTLSTDFMKPITISELSTEMFSTTEFVDCTVAPCQHGGTCTYSKEGPKVSILKYFNVHH